jgi:hypothetical protein
MAKRNQAPASTGLLAGADVNARNGVRFAYSCKALSDGTPRTIYVSVQIAPNGEVGVRDYEERRELLPGMDEDTAMLFSDRHSVDEGTVEGSWLPNFDSHIQ